MFTSHLTVTDYFKGCQLTPLRSLHFYWHSTNDALPICGFTALWPNVPNECSLATKLEEEGGGQKRRFVKSEREGERAVFTLQQTALDGTGESVI